MPREAVAVSIVIPATVATARHRHNARPAKHVHPSELAAAPLQTTPDVNRQQQATTTMESTSSRAGANGESRATSAPWTPTCSRARWRHLGAALLALAERFGMTGDALQDPADLVRLKPRRLKIRNMACRGGMGAQDSLLSLRIRSCSPRDARHCYQVSGTVVR